jgi:hypothetical protein
MHVHVCTCMRMYQEATRKATNHRFWRDLFRLIAQVIRRVQQVRNSVQNTNKKLRAGLKMHRNWLEIINIEWFLERGAGPKSVHTYAWPWPSAVPWDRDVSSEASLPEITDHVTVTMVYQDQKFLKKNLASFGRPFRSRSRSWSPGHNYGHSCSRSKVPNDETLVKKSKCNDQEIKRIKRSYVDFWQFIKT